MEPVKHCHSWAAGDYRGQNPTAFAGLQTRTPQAARSASAMDDASQSVQACKILKPIPDSGLRPAPE